MRVKKVSLFEKSNMVPINRDSGSAMAWVIMLMLVATILLAVILPLAYSSMTMSKWENHRNQAHETAKSVTDMVVSYIVNHDDDGPGKQIIEAVMSTPDLEGVTYEVNGLNSDELGTCKVTVQYNNNMISVVSTATYGEEIQSVGAVLQKEVQVGMMEVSNQSPTSYPGILSNRIKSEYGSVWLAEGTNTKPVYATSAISEAVVTVEKPEDVVPFESVSDILVNEPVIKGSHSDIYGGPVLGNGSVSVLNMANDYTVIPKYLEILLADGTVKKDYFSYYAVNGIALSGTIRFTSDQVNPVLMKSSELSLIGSGEGIQFADGYQLEATENIVLNNVRIASGNIKASQTVNIYCNEYGDHSTILAPITCDSFQVSIIKAAGDQTKPLSVVNIGTVTANSVMIETGDTVSQLNIDTLMVAGDAVISGKGVTIKNLIANGSVTIGNYVAVEKLSCSGNLSVDAYSAIGKEGVSQSVISLGDMSIRNAAVYEAVCAGTFTVSQSTMIDSIEAMRYVQYGESVTHINNGDKLWIGESFIQYTEDGGTVLYQDGPGRYSWKKNKGFQHNNKNYNFPDISVITVTCDPSVSLVTSVDSFPEVSGLPFYELPSDRTELPTGVSVTIDERDFSSFGRAYVTTISRELQNLKVNSHGDTYIVVNEGVTLTIDEISSEVYYGNLYFILEKDARLTLGKDESVTKNRISVFGKEGSSFVTNGDCLIEGVIQSVSYESDEKGEFRYLPNESLSGVFQREDAKWRLVQYAE